MSGGSYDYIGGRISDIYLKNCDTDPRRASFQKLLKLVGRAMHDIEWVDSWDYAPEDDHKSIDECFAFLQSNPELIKKAHAFDDLSVMLQKYFKTET